MDEQTLPHDLLYAYIGLVWLLLQDAEKALDAVLAARTPLLPALQPSQQAASASASHSFWHDPLGLRALANAEDACRHPAVRNFVAWKAKLMDGLLESNHLSAQERTAIAELFEYGVSIRALADSLRASIESAEQLRRSRQQQKPQDASEGAQSSDSAAPTLKDTSYSILYNLLFTALKSVVVTKRELRYDARLRNLLRQVSYIVFEASSMGGNSPDDRERSKIKSLLLQEIERGAAQQIWSEITDATKNDGQQAARTVEARHSVMSWQSKLLALGAATVGGGIVIGLTGGIAAPLLSAGLGTLFSYAGMTGVIATGIVEGLGTAGGTVALATLFGVTGGSTTAYSVSRRLKDVDDVDLVPVIEQNPSMHIAFCISGFLFSKEDVSEPWSVLPAYVPFSVVEALQFETACLLEVGAALERFISMNSKVEQIATDLPVPFVSNPSAQQIETIPEDEIEPLTEPSPEGASARRATIHKIETIIPTTFSANSTPRRTRASMSDVPRRRSTSASPTRISSSARTSVTSPPNTSAASTNANQSNLKTSGSLLNVLATAIAWPVSLLQSGYIVDNPWALGLDRAEKVGIVLAREILLNRLRGHRPITLVGFSLGACAIFHALLELAAAGESLDPLDPYAIVDSVYLLGMPVPNDPELWRRAASVVNGRWVNAFAPNDWVLQFLQRSSIQNEFSVAGLAPVPRPSMPPSTGESVAATPISLSVPSEIRLSPSMTGFSVGRSSVSSAGRLSHGPSTTASHISGATTDPLPSIPTITIDQSPSKWVENIDISHIIDTHLDYLHKLPLILDYIGFERPSMVTRSAAAAATVFSTSSIHKSSSTSSFSGLDISAGVSPIPGMHQSTSVSVTSQQDHSAVALTHGDTDIIHEEEVLFENPYVDEDVVVHGIYSTSGLAADAAANRAYDDDDDEHTSKGKRKSWSAFGAPFGRQLPPLPQEQIEQTERSKPPLIVCNQPSQDIQQ